MALATYAIPSFLGGEISGFAQGRFDRPDYRTSMKVCRNSFPLEIGAWTRRPGTRFAGTTRGGGPGRVAKFDFSQMSPYTLEFTDSWLRFRSGASLICTNDQQAIVAISTANPAVVQTAAAHGWTSGNTVVPLNFGFGATLLQNRQFLISVVDPTHFQLFDAVGGLPINGAGLEVLPAGAAFGRVQEYVTPYTGGRWANVRIVQAETTAIMLNNTIQPQALSVSVLPVAGLTAPFQFGPASFVDGPYLDPFTNGVQATPSALSGTVSLTLSFAAYSATTAYSRGSYVTSAGVVYVSLTDGNVNNVPAASPTVWTATSAFSAIGPNGIQGSDIGRLVRLFSEPLPWAPGSVYVVGAVVSYNPSGIPGAATYWTSLIGANTGHIPGQDTTSWVLTPQGAAVWTWGKIVSLSTGIDRALAGSVSIGDMTAGGGINAVFNGAFAQPAASSAEKTLSGGAAPAGTVLSQTSYVGKDYSGAAAQKVQQVTVYPSSDQGFAFGTSAVNGPPSGNNNLPLAPTITLNLRGKATVPASASDGTVLGTSGPFANNLAAVTIVSADVTTAWNYVWIEQIVTATTAGVTSYSLTSVIGQLSVFNPPGSGTSTGCSIAILGPPLLYTNPITTWRLGAYSDTTGWPTCGCYHEGRLWIGGAIANRFDGCVSNGIAGSTLNFAPTNQFGAVAASNAISYVLNSDGVNPIYWMQPDLQGIIIGTQAGEWLVQAPTTGPLSPTNIAARRVTRIGSANIEPRRTEHTNIFVQRYRRKLTEYFPDVSSGKFTGPNLADKAEHFTKPGVTEIAYTGSVTPVIWGRCDDGSLFGITYKRDTLTTVQPPTFAAWHGHTLGTLRTVESICNGPSVDGNLDTLVLVTNDFTSVRHVELLTETPAEDQALSDAWYLDDAVAAPSSGFVAPSTDFPYGGIRLYGLWHLNNRLVQVWAGGLDCGDPGEGKAFADFVVTNGSLFIPYGDGISAGSGRGLFNADFVATLSHTPIVVGCTYTSDGQPVRPVLPQDTGARNGPAFGKLSRGHRYSLKLVNTGRGLVVGANFAKKLDPVAFKSDGGRAYTPLQPFTGVYQDELEDDYTYDDMICWRQTRPQPANITLVAVNLATQDQ